MKLIAMELFVYFLGMGLITYLTMAYDKKKSKRSRKGKGRIPERTLLFLGLIGGAAGGWLAMSTLHHKTLHRSFRFCYPGFTVLHAILLFYLLGKS